MPVLTSNLSHLSSFSLLSQSYRRRWRGVFEEIVESNLAIAIEIAPGVISLLTESRSELAGKSQEVGEIHIAIVIEIGRG